MDEVETIQKLQRGMGRMSAWITTTDNILESRNTRIRALERQVEALTARVVELETKLVKLDRSK